MKKILKSFIFCLLVFTLSFSLSSSQANNQNTQEGAPIKSFLIANISLGNINSEKIKDGQYSVSFDIINEKGIQSDIRYGIQLVKKTTGEILDMNLANVSLTLGENEHKNIQMNYSIPSFIHSGVYRILIVVQNSEGIPLAKSPIVYPEKFITIDSANNGINLEDCYITILNNTSNTKYSFDDGVSIKLDEEISATCKIQNNTNTVNNNLKLQLITHSKNQFGDILSNEILEENILVNGGESKTISFKIPTLENSQIYNIDTFLINRFGEKVSPSKYFEYTILGDLVTIKNIYFEESSYKTGDTASLRVFWSKVTENSLGQDAEIKNNSYILNAKIKDMYGIVCGETKKNITSINSINNTEINVSINTDCQNVIADINITDRDGNVLSESEININNKEESVNINSNVPTINNRLPNINKYYIVLFVLVLVLIGYGIIKFKKLHQIKN